MVFWLKSGLCSECDLLARDEKRAVRKFSFRIVRFFIYNSAVCLVVFYMHFTIELDYKILFLLYISI